MKSMKSYFACGAALLALSMTSCSDWLDCNVDPENPTSESAAFQNRLPHIQFYTNSANQFAAWRNTFACGDWTRYNGGGTYQNMSIWYPTESIVTTPYQWWFVGACANINDMYTKAVAAGAWHYAGAAKLILAYGHMLMADLYGEMPYTEAVGPDAVPAYSTGKVIYLGCLADLDEAIEQFQKTQEATVPTLQEGDSWNNGDVQKWLKLAYLLKARYCNKLSKKGAGSYKDGKYDEATILDCLSKAMQSNSDNTIVNHTDANSKTHDVLGWDEPVDYSPLYSVSGMNAGYYVTEMLYNNLTNFAGYGVEDPRADHIIPWQVSVKSANTPANIKWKGEWRRSLGVDMTSSKAPNLTGGPLRANYGIQKGKGGDYWWIDSDSEARLGDTIYVEQTSESKGYAANIDLLFRRNGTDASRESGTFYTRVSSPTYIGTYMEACFIKAEVLFNKGDKSGAFTAYKEGIKASIELMNSKLKVWCNEDENLKKCPSFTPIEQADIDNFLANGIGSSADITLGKIMTQKRLALMFSMENWNDMRRYDYNPEIFLGWGIPAAHEKNAGAQKAIPNGKTFRRWRQCSHEYKYNSANLQAIGDEVPGADMSYDDGWNKKEDAWTINVWWDSDQQ